MITYQDHYRDLLERFIMTYKTAYLTFTEGEMDLLCDVLTRTPEGLEYFRENAPEWIEDFSIKTFIENAEDERLKYVLHQVKKGMATYDEKLATHLRRAAREVFKDIIQQDLYEMEDQMLSAKLHIDDIDAYKASHLYED